MYNIIFLWHRYITSPEYVYVFIIYIYTYTRVLSVCGVENGENQSSLPRVYNNNRYNNDVFSLVACDIARIVYIYICIHVYCHAFVRPAAVYVYCSIYFIMLYTVPMVWCRVWEPKEEKKRDHCCSSSISRRYSYRIYTV